MDSWYSLPGFDQPFSSFSHFIGAVVFGCLTVPLLATVWHDRARYWPIATFAFSAVALLSISGCYHMFPVGPVQALLLRLDVAAIFILIAASFTPLHGILFRGWKRWGMLLLIWTFAIVGLTLRIVFFARITKLAGSGIFLAMGWLGAVSAYLIWKSYGWPLLGRIVAGGVFYTVGAISNGIRWPIIIPYVWGPHETFHLAVLAGLGCHWWVVTEIARSHESPANPRESPI